MKASAINRTCGHVLLGLSLFAMLLIVGAVVLVQLGLFHPTPDGDEGVLAHLFQISVVLLVPAGLVFLGTADWSQPRNAMKRLVVPAVALLVAFSTLYYMEHLRQA